MKPREVVTYYRTQMAAALAIGVSKQAVSLWIRTGEVPMDKQVRYEDVTGGELRAAIPDAMRDPERTEAAARERDRERARSRA